MEDREIVELYWQRDQRALAETAESVEAYCFSIANNILMDPEDARECVNDAYLAAWNAIPPHRPERLAPFVGKLTRRIAVNRLEQRLAARRGGGETALALEELGDCISGGEGIEENVEAAELSAAINRFLRRLPSAQRDVFICRYWYLDPIESISLQFGFTPSKVKSMLFRTRQKLQKYLKKEELL